jgi:hypothetical protein
LGGLGSDDLDIHDRRQKPLGQVGKGVGGKRIGYGARRALCGGGLHLHLRFCGKGLG